MNRIDKWIYVLVLLALGIVVFMFFVNRADAVGNGHHNEWHLTQEGKWGDCEPVSDECEEEAGVQSRTNTYTCTRVDGSNGDECEITRECPAGYEPSKVNPDKCYKWDGRRLVYVDYNYTPETKEEVEEQKCRVEEPKQCSTVRICHWDGEGYEAQAVTEQARRRHFNAHEQDKDWEEGMDRLCEFEPEPEPPVPPTPQPRGTTEAGAPICQNLVPVLSPANVLVWRRGGTAIVQWQPTEGNRANVYYYENQNRDNAHAVRDTENDGYVEINELSGLDWTFGVQQANDCAGGETVWVVDGNTQGWVLFH